MTILIAVLTASLTWDGSSTSSNLKMLCYTTWRRAFCRSTLERHVRPSSLERLKEYRASPERGKYQITETWTRAVVNTNFARSIFISCKRASLHVRFRNYGLASISWVLVGSHSVLEICSIVIACGWSQRASVGVFSHVTFTVEPGKQMHGRGIYPAEMFGEKSIAQLSHFTISASRPGIP